MSEPTRHRTVRYEVNGVEYDALDDVPEEFRDLLRDRDGDGVPDPPSFDDMRRLMDKLGAGTRDDGTQGFSATFTSESSWTGAADDAPGHGALPSPGRAVRSTSESVETRTTDMCPRCGGPAVRDEFARHACTRSFGLSRSMWIQVFLLLGAVAALGLILSWIGGLTP